jgi:hypothetical protein
LNQQTTGIQSGAPTFFQLSRDRSDSSIPAWLSVIGPKANG